MNKFLKILVVCLVAYVFSACGPTIMIPPAMAEKTPLLDICEGRRDDACQARLRFAKRVIDSTVSITSTSYRSSSGAKIYGGTGFVIDDQHVLTAWHVVEKSPIIYINFRTLGNNGKISLASRGNLVNVVAYDRKLDVALLKITEPTVKLPPPLPIRLEPLTIGEGVWQFGRTSVWTWGNVVQRDVTIENNENIIMASAACQPGDSGGPLVDTHGRLVGITLRVSTVTNYGYFVPSGAALKALFPNP